VVFDSKKAGTVKIASDHVLALAETVAHVGHWSWNSDTQEVFWSPECFNIFGRDPDTWIPTGENFLGDMPDEDREKLEQANLRGFESGEPFELEYRYFRGGSRDDVRWIRVFCDFLVDANGTKHMVGIAQDITESKQAETALQESEGRFKDIAEASGDWFWETDADHRFTWFSDRVEEVAGVPVEFHIGKSRLELAADQVDQEKWRAHLETLEARRPFRDFRYLRRGHDGRLQHMSSSGVPVFDAEGNFKGYRGAGTDISAEVKAEQLAASAQESFMAAIESVSDGFALFDADDRMVFCNSRFKELNPDLTPKIVPGVTFEELLRENIAAKRILDALGDEEAFIRERMERHRNPRSPLVQQRRDGRWLELREERTPEGSTFLVNTDITERILAEEALRESEERFRTLVEYAPEAITMLDVDTGLYVDANPMAETLHGLPRDALIGKLGPADLSPEIQPDGRPSAEAAPDYLSRALAG
jgi:PAS domain S-box-containing protein